MEDQKKTKTQLIAELEEMRRRVSEEKKNQLLQTVTLAVAKCQNLHSALEVTLRNVVEATGWDFGEAWLPNSSGTALEYNQVWFGSNKDLEKFKRLSKEFTFPLGLGLPGRVWLSKQPEWIQDVSVEPDTHFCRAMDAAKIGLKASFGVPVSADNQVLAVLVFFMVAPHEEDMRLMELVSAVTAQVGSIILRSKAEEAIRNSEASLAQAQRIAHLGSWDCDLISDKCTWSNELYRILGYDRQIIAPSRAAILDHVHPDDQEYVKKTILEFTRDSEVEKTFEYRIIRRDGAERFIKGSLWKEKADNPIKMKGTLLDITELKQAQRAMQESEEKYRSIFENALEGIFQSTPEGRFLSANPAMARIWGYETPEEMIASVKNIPRQIYVNPHLREELENLIQEKDEVRGLEYQVRKKNKEVIWVLENARTVRDASGKLLYYEGNIQDITERKQAEEKICQSRENQRILLDNIQTQVWYLTDDHTYGAVNKAHADFVGIKVEELAFKDMFEVFSKEFVEARQKKNAEVFKTGQKVTTEAWVLNASGERRLISIVKSPKRDDKGNVEYVVCSAEDITERVQAEQALRESEEKLRSTLMSIDDLVFSLDMDGVFSEYYQPPGNSDVYLSPEMFLGKAYQEVLPPSIAQLFDDSISAALSSGGVEQIEYSLPMLGETKWYNARISSRKNKVGEHIGTTVVVRDITKQKQAEAEIRHQISELETLYENGLAISGLLDQKKIARRVIEVLEQNLDWHHVAIRLYHSESDQLELLAFNLPGVEKGEMKKQIDHLNQVVSTPNQGLSGWVVKHKRTARISNLSEDNRYVETYPDLESGLYVPLMVGDSVIGSIAVESKKKSAFSAEDERLLLTLANQAAISLENAQLYLDLQHELEERFFAEEQLVKLNLELEQRVATRTAEIESTRRRLELATSVAGFGVWERTVGFDEQIWDAQMHNIYGTSSEEFKPTYAKWLEFVYPNDREMVKEKIERALEESVPYAIEYRIIRTDGSLRQIVSRAVALFDQENNRTKMIGVNIDVTTTRQAEETLRMANTELERALRVKDEFLANMSHELRTPLNAILGLSESLLEQIAGTLNEKQQRYLRTISESGHHLLEMINDILDLAKIEAGQVILDIGKVNIHQVCQASIRMVKQQAQKKEQKITVEIDEDINMLWADERRLKQMIVNLLSNAVKFTPQGGKLGIKVEARRANNAILIRVWDNGIGISAEDQKRLFKPFVQLDSGLARENVGTGLGLALIAQLARLHGGHLEIDSTPNHGSCFTICLLWKPAKQTGPLPYLQEGNETTTTVSSVGKGNTILLVEDTDEVVMMVKDYLELRGYHVAVAKNGRDGIAEARRIHPDLILMDVMMPIMDGLEATRKIKSELALAKIPIIGMTALAMQKDRESCLAAGMNEYLSKPVELKELLSLIQHHLSSEEERNL